MQDPAEPERGGGRDRIARRTQRYLVLSAVITVLSFFGTFHWTLELLSHFVAWFALGTSVLFAILLSCRRWRWAVAAGALIAIQASAPLAWYWPHDKSPSPANCRVLLANVLTSNTDKQSILDLIAQVDPDIICLQEVDSAWAEALAPLEAIYPVHSTIPRSDNFGIALYSRFPGAMQGVLFQQEHHIPALTATAIVNGRKMEILGLHTLPPIGKAMADQRNAQLNSGRAWLEARPDSAILLGDLNITMFSPVYRHFMAEIDVRNAREGFGPVGTWPSWVPFMRLPLDQCLVKGEIHVVTCIAGPNIGSDHLPLIADLYVSSP